MSQGAKWADLAPRIISAIVMLVVGLGAVLAGGIWFTALVALAAAGMVYELRLLGKAGDTKTAIFLGLLAGVATGVLAALPMMVMVPVIAGLMAAISTGIKPAWRIALGAGAILLACVVLLRLRLDFGVIWVLWLVLVVVASDVAGYFAGRLLGGPKFWPQVSPSKTWSGTIAGWVAAAAVGAVFAISTGAGIGAGAILIPISAAMALAAQLGDIGESILKRRAGVKDASRLIPGHGGLLDRFDGLIGASLVAIFVVGAL